VNTMGSMGIQQKIAWFFVERLRTLELWNGKLVRFLAQERIREANPQGPMPLERNREGLGALVPRPQDPAPREGQYKDREEE
jgi:hypothetical protein